MRSSVRSMSRPRSPAGRTRRFMPCARAASQCLSKLRGPKHSGSAFAGRHASRLVPPSSVAGMMASEPEARIAATAWAMVSGESCGMSDGTTSTPAPPLSMTQSSPRRIAALMPSRPSSDTTLPLLRLANAAASSSAVTTTTPAKCAAQRASASSTSSSIKRARRARWAAASTGDNRCFATAKRLTGTIAHMPARLFIGRRPPRARRSPGATICRRMRRRRRRAVRGPQDPSSSSASP